MKKWMEILIERVMSAHRPSDARRQLRFHPAWHDLNDAARQEAFERTLVARKLEAAADAEGLSTTAKAILAKLR
jgi:hypothetical protein